ncbi:ECF transporter S component [Streptococcus oralis]|uniref:ECF transporter S component n=1 Tax=Streptococcus oralis subsp. dentisani TaxID=1458253 RepID=A0A1X1J3T5_STROR|nr:ECF transporter S component [Streptococcus oralis]ORO80032.1 ECF transporter S component [Streptococcus oralis subsp. dentisani]
MKQIKTNKIALVSILTALSVVLGYIVKIPTQTGILTFLDTGIFFTAFYFGRREGGIVGGLGGFIIDLISGYPHWMFFSLIFHGLQGYFAGFKGKWQWLGLLLATIIMVAGYAFATAWMKGWGIALADVPHNLLQNFIGMVVGFLLNKSIKKIK